MPDFSLLQQGTLHSQICTNTFLPANTNKTALAQQQKLQQRRPLLVACSCSTHDLKLDECHLN